VLKLSRGLWGYLPEERGLYPRLTVLHQLVYIASLYGKDPADARRDARQWLARFRITELEDRRAEQLSKGNQQKVQFIAAVLHDPEILLLDEPFTGLDPVNVGLLKDAIHELRDEGRTVVFSTHQMELAEALCESVAIIDHGRVVAGGPVRALKKAAGRRMARLAFDHGAGHAWLEGMPGMQVVRAGADYTDVALADDADATEILRQVMARGAPVARFEVSEPTLEALFIELVGRTPDEADEVGA
jgi:ABC-2 type transport system ATP-binding protein